MNVLGLGQTPVQVPGLPSRAATGIQYTTGTPPMTPVLRPLRQSMYDSEVYPAAGVARLDIFANHTTFSTPGIGRKTLRDTNMRQDGNLGTPLEYDLVGFIMEWERGISVADHIALYNAGVFKWFFGQTTTWLEMPDTKIPEGIGAFAALDGNAAPTSLIANGWPVTQNFYNFSTPDLKARRVTSNESFRCQKEWPTAPIVSRNLRLTVYMLGLLYGQL